MNKDKWEIYAKEQQKKDRSMEATEQFAREAMAGLDRSCNTYIYFSNVVGGIVLAFAIFVFGVILYVGFDNYKKLSSLDYAVQKQYTTYVDGVEVDLSNIDPHQYTFTVDDTNKKLYLTK